MENFPRFWVIKCYSKTIPGKHGRLDFEVFLKILNEPVETQSEEIAAFFILHLRRETTFTVCS